MPYMPFNAKEGKAMKLMIACGVSNGDASPEAGTKLNRIRKHVLGDANRNVASWIYGIISAVSPEGAGYAEELHGMKTPGQKLPGRIIKPFAFSLYGTSVGMNIQIRSVSDEFNGWIKLALANVETLPPLDLRDSRGNGPILKPEKVIESTYGKNLKIEMETGRSPAGRMVFLAKARLFTLSPLVLKGREDHLKLSEAAFSPAGDPAINRYILSNLLVKHMHTASSGNGSDLSPGLVALEMEEKALLVSFSRGARTGWTKVSGSVVPFIEGRFTLTTHPELLYTALNNGIGARTALGFGMVELHNDRKYNGE